MDLPKYLITVTILDETKNNLRTVMRIKDLTLFLAVGISSLLGILQFTAPIQADSEPTGLSDDPRLLVMLEGNISGANVPTRIRFLVPEAAEMFSAGSKDPQGTYSGGPPDRTASQISGWDEISYELKNKIFRVEYYDPIVLGQIEKTIAYDFISLYPVSSLKTIIQVPSTATNFSVTPPGTKTFEGSFTVYTYNNSSIQANKTLHFDIGYSKSNPNPSLGNTTAPAQGSGNWNPLPIMIFGGIIIIAGTLFWAIKTTRKDRRKPNTVLTKSFWKRQTASK
jgi:hypothetical protein